MTRRLTVLLLVLPLLPLTAMAQLFEDFADGELSANPAWTGDLSYWSVVPYGADFALRTAGLPASDTLYLSTASSAGFGRWSFTFQYENVNLSNFNGCRIFLLSDADDLTGAVHGYYLQLGTNNSDQIGLYRQDGAASTGRVLLARTDEAWLDASNGAFDVVVERSWPGDWTVLIDGAPVLSATDATYTTSRAFGLWVKHTAASAQAYLFDHFVIESSATPGDTVPPFVKGVSYSPDPPGFHLALSEPVPTASAINFFVDAVGQPVDVLPSSGTWPADSLLLLTGSPITDGVYHITVQGLADPSGNVMADTSVTVEVDAGSPATSIPPGAIVINEIHFAPSSSDLEFVEVFNRSDATVNLRSLTLSDATGRTARVATGPFDVVPGGYVALARNGATLKSHFPAATCIELADWPALNNDGDAVVLRSGDAVVDSVSYRASWSEPAVSLERIDPFGPSSHALNWSPSTHPGGATPGTINSVYARDLTPPFILLVEHIAPDEVIVWFSESLDSVATETAVFDLNGLGPVDISPDGDARWRLRFASALSPQTAAELSASGLRDLSGNVADRLAAHIAFLPAAQDLIVNEIMYEPLTDDHDGRPEQPEYVELYNRTGHALSLNGLFFTSTPDENGDADTLRVGAPLAIAPGGLAVIFAQSPEVSDPATESFLALAFPEAALTSPTVSLLPVPRSSLSLSNEGELIRLHRRDGVLLDEVTYDPNWHHPGLAQTIGIALERISPELPPDAGNWNSSPHASGGTPGYPNLLYLPPGEPMPERGLRIAPSPFSPDADGHDDHALISYTLGEVGGSIRVRIFDSRGRLVRTLEPSGAAGRTGQLLWDGRDDAGRSLQVGIYIVLMEAVFPSLGRTEAYRAIVVLARALG